MTYITVSCLTLFITTFNGLSRSASITPNVMDALESLMVDKLLMNKVDVVDTDIMRYKSDMPSADSKKGISLWNPKEPIPVYFSNELSRQTVYVISNALNEIQSKSCLRFSSAKESDFKKGVIIYRNGRGCYSFLGKQRGGQAITLPDRLCSNMGTAIHETLHALGFVHEQQRSDRDDYVKIIKENIEKSFERQFDKLEPEEDHILGPYDYESIMHYGSTAFAKAPNLTTIQPLKKGIVLPPVYKKYKLSKSDAEKLNKLYNCASLNKNSG